MTKAKNILSLIEEEHRKVEALFEEIENTKQNKKIEQLFQQIYQELTLHAQAEELVFYPAMQEYEKTKPFIEEAEEEHNSVKIALEQIKSLSPKDSEFSTKIQELKKQVQHHVEEEEQEIFTAVRECIDDKELQEMAKKFQETKSRLEPKIAEAFA